MNSTYVSQDLIEKGLAAGRHERSLAFLAAFRWIARSIDKLLTINGKSAPGNA